MIRIMVRRLDGSLSPKADVPTIPPATDNKCQGRSWQCLHGARLAKLFQDSRDWQRVDKYDRPIGRPVELDRMFGIEVRAGWQQDIPLGRANKDVTISAGVAIEPVRIVECTATYAQDVGKSLQVEVERRRTSAAEIERYALAA